MQRKSLQLPITIRSFNEDEVHMDSELLKAIEELKSANIVEGFTFKLKDDNPENENLGFKFYSEINVDNSRLWELILELSETLPENVAFLFGQIDQDVQYGSYTSKSEIFSFLSRYKKELTQDTFLSFGFIYHDKNNLTEIFIDECKYIKYWGNEEDLFRNILKKFNLEEINELEFIDEYPKVRETLKQYDESVVETNVLIEIFKQEYLKYFQN